MPHKRGKRASAGPGTARVRRGPTQGNHGYWSPANLPMRPATDGFSMRDEARNTASHQSALSWGSKLRDKPVAFVSAGFIEPLKDLEPSDDIDATNVDKSAEPPMDTCGDDVSGEPEVTEDVSLQVTELIEVVATVDEDTPAVSEPASQGQLEDTDQAAGVPDSDAKELFFYDLEGDQGTTSLSVPPPKIPSPRSSLGASDSSEEVILFRGRSANARGTLQKPEGAPSVSTKRPLPQAEAKVQPAPSPAPAVLDTTDSQNIALVSRPRRKKSRSRRSPSRHAKTTEDEEEDAILADYIANMAADSDDDFITRQLQSLSGQRDLGGEHHAVDIGASDGEKCPVGSDLVGNETTSSEGSGVSDAEEDDEFMERDEDQQDMDADTNDDALVRFFRQDELDIAGDELLLASSSSYTQIGGTKRRSKHSLNKLANAMSVADAFDSLDIGRPARKRRSKQPPNFNVSDSEIEAALQSAWRRDRERKKKRKMERDTLRAEGLLGKNVNPDDLRIKYPSAMTLDDMKAEMTSFLLSTMEQLEFPPLDKHARKILHELADKFNIKSKSTGAGQQRRPVLYRTNRTVRYAPTRAEEAASHVDAATWRIHRKYFHRVDVNVKKTKSPKTTAGGGGGFKALRLREGEIVGASVPELGQENKGRVLLEKMGWSKGMALGAEGNTGILEPVAQVVKRSKAGLG